MRRAARYAVLLGMVGLTGTAWGIAQIGDAHSASTPSGTSDKFLRNAYGASLVFEPNEGQTHRDVRFFARGIGYTVFLTQNAALLQPLPKSASTAAALELRLIGANRQAHIDAEVPLPGKSHYLGKNGSVRSVVQYAKVKYQDIYLGIDITYRGGPQQLALDFVVAPGADPRAILLSYDGADTVAVNEAGDLVVSVAGTDWVQRAPRVFQDLPHGKAEIEAGYKMLCGAAECLAKKKFLVGINLGAYDRDLPVYIQPILAYAGGGKTTDQARDITADQNGNVYITGAAAPVNLYAADAPPPRTDRDVFVTKIDVRNGAASYTAFIGGSGEDRGESIAVDKNGDVYVAGTTASSDFPLAGAPYMTAKDGGDDAFVFKLAANGSALSYSTFLGGGDSDIARGIAVDSLGNTYITGETRSWNFPTTPGGDRSCGNDNAAWECRMGDVFVTKLNASGTALVYSRFFGGHYDETAGGIAVDRAGYAYITGSTQGDIPVVNAMRPSCRTCPQFPDAFIAKFSPGGSVAYSTYLGGIYDDYGRDIAVDRDGNAFVTGTTWSIGSGSGFPLLNAYRDTNPNGYDAFVAKLAADGSQLRYSSYVGGSGNETAGGITVNESGNAYVAGWTDSIDFAIGTPAARDSASPTPRSNAFMAKIDASGTALIYSVYAGNAAKDSIFSIAHDDHGNIFTTGETLTNAMPGDGDAEKRMPAMALGRIDAAVARITDTDNLGAHADIAVTLQSEPETVVVGEPLAYTLTLTNYGPNDAVSVTAYDALPDNVTLVAVTSSQGSCTGTRALTCSFGNVKNGATVTARIVVTPNTAGMLQNALRVNAANADSNGTNNSVAVLNTAGGNTDLVIGIATDTDPIVAGRPVNYHIDVVNRGTGYANGVVVQHSWSGDATLVSASVAEGNCTHSGGVACKLGKLAPGERRVVAVVLTAAAGMVSNTVSVSAHEIDAAPADNSAFIATRIGTGPDLAVSATSTPDSVTVGKPLTYIFRIQNLGKDAATDVMFYNTLPTDARLISINASQGTCNTATPIVCKLGALTQRGSATVNLVLAPVVAGTVISSARVGALEPDPDLSNNTVTHMGAALPALEESPPNIIRKAEFQGIIEAIGNSYIVVSGMKVVYDDDTVISFDDPTGRLFAIGQSADIEGRRSQEGSVVADRIQVQ